ncbi:MAG: 4Fe-4S dicluster domain-containing protein [Coriobacteriales bacterium]|jgi:anaerobic dimethyl sulfoxide reductase subunit B (iron-sulfur subunit)|nr:4Fe-4S dicluster domain-containing protein [Coriobacteriales bacterium]
MTQYGFYFDQGRCYGCKACSVACKDWNDIAPGAEKWMSVYMWEKGTFPLTSIGILAFSCGHCDNPVCVEACGNDAIIKEDKYGAVLVDKDKCQGDRNCFAACPYGAPKFASDEPGTKMGKCSMCIDRLENGQLPLCVASCPMRALDFGPIEELAKKYGNTRKIETMPDPNTTMPNWIAKANSPKEQLIPYDVDKALQLTKRRTATDDVYFGDINAVTEFPLDTICISELRMKNATVAEVLSATSSDQG